MDQGQIYMGQAVPVTGQPYLPQQGPPTYFAHPEDQRYGARPNEPPQSVGAYGGRPEGFTAYQAPNGQVLIQMPYNPHANMSNDQIDRMEELAQVFHMSKSIKCFAIIDCFLVTLYALSYFILIFLLPLPIVGYYGAKKYQPSLVTVYAVFLVVFAIFGRCVLLFYSETFFHQMLMAIVICIEIFILKVVVNFIGEIKTLTDEDRLLLELGPVPLAGPMVW